RKYPVDVRSAYTDIDTVEIILPAGYKAESMPKATYISSPFGEYYNEVKLEGDRMFYYRKMVNNSGKFAPETYKELVDFQAAVYKADRNRVVLVKDESAGEKKAF